MFDKTMTFSLQFVLAILVSATTVGQNKPFDTSIYRNWKFVDLPVLSNNGKYVSYQIKRGTIHPLNDSIIIQSVDGSWRKSMPSTSDEVEIDSMSQFLVTRTGTDSICIIKLGSDEMQIVDSVSAFAFIACSRYSYLVYARTGSHDLVVKNVITGSTRIINGIQKFFISPNKQFCIAVQKIENSDTSRVLLMNGNMSAFPTICNASGVRNIVFDKEGQRLALDIFVGSERKRMIGIYSIPSSILQLQNADSINGIDEGLVFGDVQKFSNDSKRLFITVKNKPVPISENSVKLIIWNYKDRKMQSLLRNEGPIREYQGTYLIDSVKVFRFQRDTDDHISVPEGGNDEWATMNTSTLQPGVAFVRKSYLVSTVRDIRIELKYVGELSPDGKYLVYFDNSAQTFGCFDINQRRYLLLGKDIKTSWNLDLSDYYYQRAQVAAWSADSRYVYVYDRFDLWKLDLFGKMPSINLTSAWGARNQTFLTFLFDDKRTIDDKHPVYLSMFNFRSKKNGICQVDLCRSEFPKVMVEGDFFFCSKGNPYIPGPASFVPIKARDKQVFLFLRQTSKEPPNYFVTKDFLSFNKISFIARDESYNWHTTKLHEWKAFDGQVCQGLMYLPGNFDSTRKYPVVIYFYDKLSDNLNLHITPIPSDGRLNIPLFASNGYIVFCPDMHYDESDMLNSSFRSMKSAVGYLSTLPYIDSLKIGLQGISWGSIQANYIFTRFNKFAAVCTSSGMSDFFSQYNGIDHGTTSHIQFEGVGFGPRKTLWDTAEWYIQKSPIMHLTDVTSPVLIFHTTEDDACPFNHAMEMFNGLRRLGKKAWLLEYEKANHGVYGDAALDFDIRIRQFFDYYLKQQLPPKWMTLGRSPGLMGIDDSLDPDPKGTP